MIKRLQNDNNRNASVHDQSQVDNNDQIENIKFVCNAGASEQPQPLPRHLQRACRPAGRLAYYYFYFFEGKNDMIVIFSAALYLFVM